MPQYQASSDSLDSAKGSARDTADQTKRATRETKDDTKQWARNAKESAADSWEQTKQWGQDTSKRVQGNLNAKFEEPGKNVLVDLGHPLINRVFDGFVKVGSVGALHAISQESCRFLFVEETNKKSLESSLERVGKEAVQWGLVAGVYSGVTYGIQEARGVNDWKNSVIGGALTGVALSLTEANVASDRVLRGAITGGAIATAAEVLRRIT